MNSLLTCFGLHFPPTFSLQASRTSQCNIGSSDDMETSSDSLTDLLPIAPDASSFFMNSGQKRNSLFFHTTGTRCTPLLLPSSTPRMSSATFSQALHFLYLFHVR